MARPVTTCAYLLAAVVSACGGSAGGGTAPASSSGGPAPDAPSISAIAPSRVFLARETDVTLSGYATRWSSSTTVDFGPGITVEQLVVASPTALQARIATTKATPLGTRDVVVHDGSSVLRYADAFQVAAPLAAMFQGRVAQGALARMTLQVLDASTPLDLTASRDLTGVVSYPNLALHAPSGVGNLGVTDASDFDVTFAVSVDVDAPSGSGDIDLVSGPEGATTEFPLPSGLKVAARAATPLVSGVAATGTTAEAYDSELYAYTPAGGAAVLDFSVTSPLGALDPAVALLPSSGHFADLLGFGYEQTAAVLEGQPIYAVYWENTGGTGPYSVTARSTAVAQITPATAGDQTWPGAVIASALPFVLTGGNHATPYGADWVELSVPGPVKLRMQTTGDLQTDTRITTYTSDASTVVGGGIDTGFAADGTVNIPSAGTYYVEFSQGMDYTPLHTTYTGIIRVD